MMATPLYVQAPSGRRRAQKPSRALARQLRREVYERDGFTCQECRHIPTDKQIAAYYELGWNPEPLQLDHIVPYRNGGQFTLDNLQTLCQPCNGRKGARV